MTWTKDTPIRGTARGSPEAIALWAVKHGAQRPGDLLGYLRLLYHLAPDLGINADVAAAQSHLETDGWRSYWWRDRRNPAGLGITGYAPQDDLSHTFATGDEAAIAHVAHLGLYTGADVPPDWAHLDPRWDAAIEAGYHGIATTLDDLTNRWAIDPDYGSKIAFRLNLMDSAGLFANAPHPPAPPSPPEASMPNFVPHRVPGLSEPLYLPDDLPLSVRLINNSNWGSQDTGTAQKFTTWHDTGITGGNAEGEWSWANNGRTGAGPAGYQAIIDDRKVIICHPFNKITWHAGTDLGNRTAYGAEQCREKIASRERAIRNAAYYHAAVCVAKGWQVDTALVQHNYWSGKNCPSYIRANGLWSSAVKQTSDAAAEIRAFLAGDVKPPQPAYERPAIIPELDAISKSESVAPFFVTASGTTWTWVGDRVRAIRATGRFQRASPTAARVGPDLKAGEEFDLDWVAFYEGAWWGYTPWGTRIRMDDVVRISDTKGEAEA